MQKTRNKIILVDDSIAMLDQGKSILKKLYEVYPAESVAKLFEILKNIRADIILLDIDMPEVDGYEAIKKLKADERNSDIPVIFMTAENNIDSERTGFGLGAVDFVTKPFSAPLLLKRVENQLLIVSKTKDLLACQEKLKEYEYANNLEAIDSGKND